MEQRAPGQILLKSEIDSHSPRSEGIFFGCGGLFGGRFGCVVVDHRLMPLTSDNGPSFAEVRGGLGIFR